MTETNTVLIVGGGASGVLLACHLLRPHSEGLRVILIERSPSVGRGIAYGTANPAHLLNVRAANMSAFPDDPGHFWRWLQENGLAASGSDQTCFVPRQIYGRYIEALLQEHVSAKDGALRIVEGECASIETSPSGVTATLRAGTRIAAALAVVATGNETSQPNASDDLYASAWATPLASAVAKDGRVLILGTGLTMIDYVQSLLHGGHRGPIVALSRRGLLPRAHRPVVAFQIARADVPFGCDIGEVLRWFRNIVRLAERHGGDWRSVVDAIRPYTQQLWQSLSLDARRRFLRHARAWWDVHRHRMAPEVEQLIADTIAAGQLTIIAGKIQSVARHAKGARVTYRPRGRNATETLEVARIVECTGIVTDPLATANPALHSLFERKLARPDALGIGLDVTDDCAVIDAAGKPSDRLFAIGPLTRAAFWEIVAVPDIRQQSLRLAERLRERLAAPAASPNAIRETME